MRQATKLTIDQATLSEAKALDINLSRAAENGIRAAVSEVRNQRWRQENAEAIDSYNDHVEKNGLPLDEYRQF